MASVPIIVAEGISKRFGENQVLTRVSLPVMERDVVCVVGPRGSGKTTLLRCLALLETPSEGRVVMEGATISTPEQEKPVKAAARAVRSDIGMVFQHFNLWPHMSVLENLIEAPIRVKKMPRAEAVAIAEALLAKVDLSDKRDAYPARLSGGQQQRVAIARALAMSPKVLLFDEATSALDPELRREVLLVMRQLALEGMTMLVVTHEMGFARHVGTRTVFMDRGEIVEEAPGAAFFDAPKTERASASCSSSKSDGETRETIMGVKAILGAARRGGRDGGSPAGRGAADAVAAVRGDQEQEAARLPVPALLLDLLPQSQDRRDRGHRRRPVEGAGQGARRQARDRRDQLRQPSSPTCRPTSATSACSASARR